MMSINERFKTIIEQLYNGNKRAFSMAIGVTPTVVENVVGTRQGKPSFDVIEKVCANANISADWLILGRGEILARESVSTIERQSIEEVEQPKTQSVAPEFIKELLDRITAQAEEIGRLQEQVKQLKQNRGHSASDANTSEIANVG